MNKKVMAFGSFDIIHPGHLHYLNAAAKLGDHLIVVVARDSTIRAKKGRPPVFNHDERAAIVGSLKPVHKAIVGNEIKRSDDLFVVIKQQKPDIVVFGYDQNVDIGKVKSWLKKAGLKTKVVRIKDSLNERKYKSSKIKKKLASL